MCEETANGKIYTAEMVDNVTTSVCGTQQRRGAKKSPAPVGEPGGIERVNQRLGYQSAPLLSCMPIRPTYFSLHPLSHPPCRGQEPEQARLVVRHARGCEGSVIRKSMARVRMVVRAKQAHVRVVHMSIAGVYDECRLAFFHH